MNAIKNKTKKREKSLRVIVLIAFIWQQILFVPAQAGADSGAYLQAVQKLQTLHSGVVSNLPTEPNVPPLDGPLPRLATDAPLPEQVTFTGSLGHEGMSALPGWIHAALNMSKPSLGGLVYDLKIGMITQSGKIIFKDQATRDNFFKESNYNWPNARVDSAAYVNLVAQLKTEYEKALNLNTTLAGDEQLFNSYRAKMKTKAAANPIQKLDAKGQPVRDAKGKLIYLTPAEVESYIDAQIQAYKERIVQSRDAIRLLREVYEIAIPAILGGVSPQTNEPPSVAIAQASLSQTIDFNGKATLSAQATDDGQPNPPATLTSVWSKISGPMDANVIFTNGQSLNASAQFSKAGNYVLRLSVSDSVLSATADVNVTVREQPADLMITNVQGIALDPKTVLVSWQTNLPASSRVDYWIGNMMNQGSKTDAILLQNHSFQLINLMPATEYRFKVSSTDEKGRMKSSTEQKILTPALPPPPAEPVTVCNAAHAHADDQVKMDEHMALFDLVTCEKASKIFITRPELDLLQASLAGEGEESSAAMSGHQHHLDFSEIQPKIVVAKEGAAYEWVDGGLRDPQDPQNVLTLDISDGEKMIIGKGITVTVGKELSEKIDWVRVDGTLKFAADRNTLLQVKTLVVNTMGMLEVGSSDKRISENAAARILILDRGERGDLMRLEDPFDFTGGIITHGAAKMFGYEKKSYALLSEPPLKGKSALRLAEPNNNNWKVGDRLVLASTKNDGGIVKLASDGKTLVYQPTQDEEIVIKEISSDNYTISKFERVGDTNESTKNKLQYDHDINMPVGNLTRNVIIESENKDDITRRGHVMFMHNPNIQIDGVGFYGLGRTDASRPHTFPKLIAAKDSAGNILLDHHGEPVMILNPGTDGNTIGRYPVHFHMRSGIKRTGAPAILRNSAVWTSPKHGVVNHGGYVLIEGNFTYDCAGSHIFAENGSEIGTVKANAGIRARGSARVEVDPKDPAKNIIRVDDNETRSAVFDFGFSGIFFWGQGGGIDVTDNFAANMRSTNYFIDTTPIKEGGKVVDFLVENLNDNRLGQLLQDEALVKKSLKQLLLIDPIADKSQADAAVNARFEELKKELADLDQLNRNLKEGLKQEGKTTLGVTGIPAYAARNFGTSFRISHHSPVGTKNRVAQGMSVVQDSIFNSVTSGYTDHILFSRVKVFGPKNIKGEYTYQGAGFNSSQNAGRQIYDHVTAVGFGLGIDMPRRAIGADEIRGGYFDNKTNIRLIPVDRGNEGAEREVVIDLDGLTFGPVAKAAGNRDISFETSGTNTAEFRFSAVNFMPERILVKKNGVVRQLFREEQGRDVKPFRKIAAANGAIIYNQLTGTVLDTMTAKEIWDQYHLAFGGMVTSSGAQDLRTDPNFRVNGFLGSEVPAADYYPYTLLNFSSSPLITTALTFTSKLDLITGAMLNSAGTQIGKVIQPIVIPATSLTPNSINIVPVTVQGQVKGAVLVTQKAAA